MSTATRARDDGDQNAGRWRNHSARCIARVSCHRYRSERFLRACAYVRTRHCTTPQASEHCLQRCLARQTLTDYESSAHRRFRAASPEPSATRNKNLHPGHSCRFLFRVAVQHLQSADNWPKVSGRDSNDPPFEMRPRFCPP